MKHHLIYAAILLLFVIFCGLAMKQCNENEAGETRYMHEHGYSFVCSPEIKSHCDWMKNEPLK